MRIGGMRATRRNAIGALVGYGGGLAVAWAGVEILARLPFHQSGSDDGIWPVVGIALAFSSFHLIGIGGRYMDRYSVFQRRRARRCGAR